MITTPATLPKRQPVQPGEIPPLSQSRQSLLACPYLYRARVLDGRAEPDNEFSRRGSQIHQLLADYINHCVELRRPSAWEYFDELVAGGLDATAVEILEPMREALQIDPERVLGTELYLALDEKLEPIEEPGATDELGDQYAREIAHEGTLDFVQCDGPKVAEIWDWKSFFQIVDADTFQAKFYPLLLFKHYPQLETIRFHLKFVRYGATRSVEYSRAKDLARLERLAKSERARQLLIHHFAGGEVACHRGEEAAAAALADALANPRAMPGGHCAYCPRLMDDCPVKEQNPFVTMAPADRVAFQVWLDAARAENLRVLKEHVNLAGPVTYADGNGTLYTAAFKLGERSSYPLQPTYEALRVWLTNFPDDNGILDKLSIGATDLNRLAKTKKRAALAEQLEPIRVTKPGTEFGISKEAADGQNFEAGT